MYVYLDMDVSSISVYCGCCLRRDHESHRQIYDVFSTPQPQRITLVNYMKAVKNRPVRVCKSLLMWVIV